MKSRRVSAKARAVSAGNDPCSGGSSHKPSCSDICQLPTMDPHSIAVRDAVVRAGHRSPVHGVAVQSAGRVEDTGIRREDRWYQRCNSVIEARSVIDDPGSWADVGSASEPALVPVLTVCCCRIPSHGITTSSMPGRRDVHPGRHGYCAPERRNAIVDGGCAVFEVCTIPRLGSRS